MNNLDLIHCVGLNPVTRLFVRVAREDDEVVVPFDFCPICGAETIEEDGLIKCSADDLEADL